MRNMTKDKERLRWYIHTGWRENRQQVKLIRLKSQGCKTEQNTHRTRNYQNKKGCNKYSYQEWDIWTGHDWRGNGGGGRKINKQRDLLEKPGIHKPDWNQRMLTRKYETRTQKTPRKPLDQTFKSKTSRESWNKGKNVKKKLSDKLNFFISPSTPRSWLWKISGGVKEAQYINTTFPPAPYMAIQKGFFFHLSFIFEETSLFC